MSRILCSGGYEWCTQKGPVFVLRYAEDQTQTSLSTKPAAKRGDVYTMIAAGEVFSVGNSIGGYLALPVQYGGRPALAIHRISGGQKRWGVQELERKFRNKQGFILRPMLGLWATSSGSAQRGVWHRYDPTTDPIVAALREAQMPSYLLTEVSAIDQEILEGGNLCKHSTTAGDSWYLCATDGTAQLLKRGGVVEAHGNQYHNGCSASPDIFRVSGGTFLIQGILEKKMNSADYPEICRVWVTTHADRSCVATAIRKIMTQRRPPNSQWRNIDAVLREALF